MTIKKGHMHPISKTIQELYGIFHKLGFTVHEGPEIETEYNNFDAVNVAKDHPARDMQDTFWLDKEKGLLLRTHISASQVPFMKENKPPFKMISFGRVFRYEATDATHEAQFHYMEGLCVEKDVSMAHLKGVLTHMVDGFFGGKVKVRLRPSYFPFVEPGIEVDISLDGKRWIEILGGGIVHEKVLQNGGIDPSAWRGYAFGVGIDRLVMLKNGVDDVRMFYNGDLRLVNQF